MASKKAPVVDGARDLAWVPIGDLKPYDKNSRVHSPKQLEKIAASIREFGFTNPVLVGAGLEVIAGHGRIEAAKLLGMESVPAIQLGYLSEQQRRALVIADNKLALDATWDAGLLASELAELAEGGFDLDSLGLAELEIATPGGSGSGEEREPKMTSDFKYQEQFGVIIICENERHQMEVYERFQSEGFTVRVVKT